MDQTEYARSAVQNIERLARDWRRGLLTNDELLSELAELGLRVASSDRLPQ